MLYRVSRSGWSGRPEIEIVRILADEPAGRGRAAIGAEPELAVAT
jgi:hypothetical protein